MHNPIMHAVNRWLLWLLKLPWVAQGRMVLFRRDKPIIETRRKQGLDLPDAVLQSGPARLLLAPFGDIGDTGRGLRDVLMYFSGHECNGLHKPITDIRTSAAT